MKCTAATNGQITRDAANREVVRAEIRAELNLVGLAMRAERKVVNKVVDGLKFHYLEQSTDKFRAVGGRRFDAHHVA